MTDDPQSNVHPLFPQSASGRDPDYGPAFAQFRTKDGVPFVVAIPSGIPMAAGDIVTVAAYYELVWP